ncbi:hypothetical protein [Cohnella massiliensis]|uniref:hypothetical protein n=1 Tax=Cohnella massiliensis TaxID=1816691 RepID=UPI0009BB0EA4|nr:hypothetical protein [Cohnella massiliensis]
MSVANAFPAEQKYIYKPDPELTRHLKSVQDHVHRVCAPHLNRPVMVETMDGDVFEGHIVHCDKGVLYLRLSAERTDRAFFPGPFGGPGPYGNFILPLVLFNLLTISLL